jgi:hypothetical protein
MVFVFVMLFSFFPLLPVLLSFVGYLSSYCLYEAVLVALLGFALKIVILFPALLPCWQAF